MDGTKATTKEIVEMVEVEEVAIPIPMMTEMEETEEEEEMTMMMTEEVASKTSFQNSKT